MNQVAALIAEKSAEVGAPDMVGVEIIPIGSSSDACDGAVVRLVRDEGSEKEISLAAGLGPEQCRELARRLLTIADASSRGSERTLMCVTAQAMWKLPGQALVVRCTPDVHFEFIAKPSQNGGGARLIKPPKKIFRA